MDILIVRGDLRTHTGYSKALRAIVQLMEPRFTQVFGVDLHYSSSKSTVSFPHHIISDSHIAGVCSREGDRAIILHFTTPDGFVPFPSAYNIGYFFWETDRFRPDLFWSECLTFMDEMWAPNEFIADLIRNHGFKGPVRIVSWPHDFSAPPSQTGAFGSTVDIIGTPESDRPAKGQPVDATSLAQLRDNFQIIFLTVTTDAPRKGLPILISEWCEYLKTRKSRSLLLLKLGSIDVTKTSATLREELIRIVARFWEPDCGNVDIGLICQSLSEPDLATLYAASDGYVTATLGEGFGGTVIECLLHGTPYISPRHTSLAELIPPSYPLVVETQSASVILPNNVPVYSPSSTWHIAKRGSIANAMMKFEALTTEERLRLIDEAQAYAARLCDENSVRATAEEACSKALQQARTRAIPQSHLNGQCEVRN